MNPKIRNDKLVNFLCGRSLSETGSTIWEKTFRGYYDNKTNEYVDEFQAKGLIHKTWEQFGGTLDKNGRRLLMHPVCPIHVDTLYQSEIEQIIERLHEKGFSEKNIRF